MARILIVDDSITFRENIKQILEDDGHTIVGIAVNGAEGVEMFRQHRPDITTMDITMPILDGITALKEILEIDSDAKVIIISSAAQGRKIAEALILGACEFLVKPFDLNKLTEAVNNLMMPYDTSQFELGIK